MGGVGGAGWAHSAVLAGGRLHLFGWSRYGQCGEVVGTLPTPRLASELHVCVGLDASGAPVAVAAVGCGTWHTAAVSASGDAFSWGWLPPRVATAGAAPPLDAAPACIEGPEDDPIVGVACGGGLVALRTAGRALLAVVDGAAVAVHGARAATRELVAASAAGELLCVRCARPT